MRLARRDVVIPGVVVAPIQTVLDCARRLPFEEALAVADSALRSLERAPATHHRDDGAD